MKTFLFTVVLCLASICARASCNTVVQHKASSTCSTNTCTVSSLTATGSGHILVFVWTGANSTNITISSLSAGGTWAHCSNCNAKDTGTDQVDMSYTLSSSSGVTSIVATLSGTPSSSFGSDVFELSCTGTPAFDVSGSGTDTTCTSCAGKTLTLSGSSDGIVQCITPGGTATAVTAPYSSNVDLIAGGGAAAAAAVSQSSGTGPTWTASSGTAAYAGIAFNDGAAAPTTGIGKHRKLARLGVM